VGGARTARFISRLDVDTKIDPQRKTSDLWQCDGWPLMGFKFYFTGCVLT